MAECLDESIHLVESVKLSSIPCLNSQKKIIFKEKQDEVSIEASSHYECALKLGHFYVSIGRVSENREATCEFVDVSSGDIFRYEICLSVGKVQAKLLDMNIESCFDNSEEMTLPRQQETAEQPPRNDDSASVSSSEAQIYDALRSYFGHREFRPLQKETILETLSGKDVIAILGTGGGKSLTFMLPALLSSKPTIVVSPTKSLIEDMIQRAQELNIPSCKYTSDVTLEERQEQSVNLAHYKLVFCTPELLQDDLAETVENLTENQGIERIVFDEAHTISSWGTTFRPVCKDVYERVAVYKCPKLLLSATVSGQVLNELKEFLPHITVLRQPIFRENLVLEAKERGPGGKFYSELADFIMERPGMTGIIYCVLASDVGKVHAELRKKEISCVKYHSQLSDAVKEESFRKWQSGECNVLVANASFGMGIDKANVRYVIHARLPTSVEEYYQQCGRAGRDGQNALCRVYFSYSDKSVLYKLFKNQTDNFEMQRQSLNDLIVLLEDIVRCRHQMIIEYFGENRDSFRCVASCDNCRIRGQFHSTDGNADALKVLQTIVELNEKNYNCNTLKLILSGSRQKVLQEHGYDRLVNFGCLSKQFSSIQLLEKFLHALIKAKIIGENIAQVSGNNLAVYIKLGEKAHDVIAARSNVIKFKKS